MENSTRTSIIKLLQESELELLAAKGGEYCTPDTAGNVDVLANFKRIAERSNVHVLQVWLVFFLKHADALQTFIDDTVSGNSRVLVEPIHGRVLDLRNYLGLFVCLVYELGIDSKTASYVIANMDDGVDGYILDDGENNE